MGHSAGESDTVDAPAVAEEASDTAVVDADPLT